MIFIELNQNIGENTQHLLLFIFTASVIWLALFLYSYKRFGLKRTGMYFLPMIVAALFIESAGVASGRYHYPGYILYFSVVGGGVPLIIILAWSANLILFMNMARHVVSKIYTKYNFLQVFLISVVAGLFGVLLDLLEDPIAHHNNWWIWEDSLAGFKFYEVPFLNFVGWFVLLFFMSLATLLIERSNFSENRKLLISISSISVTGTVIFVIHGLLLRLFQMIGFA